MIRFDKDKLINGEEYINKMIIEAGNKNKERGRSSIIFTIGDLANNYSIQSNPELFLVALHRIASAKKPNSDTYLLEDISVILPGQYMYSDISEIDLSKYKEIGPYAFKGCKNLKVVDIPNTVLEIGDEAFDSSTRIICQKDSEAYNWCLRSNHYNVKIR